MGKDRRCRIFDFIDTYAKGGAIWVFSSWQKKKNNKNAASRFSLGLSWAGQFKIYVYFIIMLAPTQHATLLFTAVVR